MIDTLLSWPSRAQDTLWSLVDRMRGVPEGSRLPAVAERRRERLARLQRVTDAVPALISYVDAEGRYRFVNARYVEWFGQDADALLGRHVREVVGEAAFERLRPDFEAALAGERRQFESEVPYKDGGIRRVRAEYVPDVLSDGTVAGYYALVTDVTESHRAEEALRASRARERAYIDHLPVGLWFVDPKGTVIYRNSAARRIWSGAAEDGPDDTGQYTAWWYGTDRRVGPADWAVARAIQRGETCLDQVLDIECFDGTRKVILNSAVPVRNADGTIMGAVVFNRDITEQKRAEQALRDADRRKVEFLATLAHELRNPLAAIHSALSVLVRLPEGTPQETPRLTAIMERQVGLMVHLLDDLLDVSRISHGKLELRAQRAALAPLVEQAVEGVRPWTERDRQELTVSIPDEPIEVQVDPVRLAQVIGNLLSNACRHTPPGGHIALQVEREGADVVLRVRDDGAGIPPDQLETIFEMFAQLSPSQRGSDAGLGVGLALARHLVELHGGRLTAHSAGSGRGSEFVVRLPARGLAAARGSSADRGPSPAVSQNGRDGRRILVVDDNADAADALAAFLSSEGHVADTANDGQRAIELARTSAPDAILLDIGMPEMNGFEVCRTIRSQPWGRDMLVIALTGWGQEHDRQSTAEAGFDAHLTKPADLAELRRLLASPPRDEPEHRRVAGGTGRA